MNQAGPGSLEQKIRQSLGRGELEEAIRIIVEGYGPEILTYLVRSMRNEADASEVFSRFCERLCRGMAGFQQRSSCRTWLYRLATNARNRFWEDPYRRRSVRLASDEISKLEQEVRSSTLSYLKSGAIDRFAKLRAELDPDEQTLLVLRVEKEMGWTEIAEILSAAEEVLGEKELKVRAATWRQRFKRLKDKMLKMAREDGLLESI
jgi:RNA polymerase sigma-70 factor, ECF subfamily